MRNTLIALVVLGALGFAPAVASAGGHHGGGFFGISIGFGNSWGCGNFGYSHVGFGGGCAPYYGYGGYYRSCGPYYRPAYSCYAPVYYAPRVVYAPPPVVYVPAPTVVYTQPAVASTSTQAPVASTGAQSPVYSTGPIYYSRPVYTAPAPTYSTYADSNTDGH